MIVFRCNAAPSVGVGHLMRCRTLAAALRERGVPSVMIGPDDAWRTADDERLFDEWLPRAWTDPEADAGALIDVCRRLDARVAILDDYRVDEAYQLCLRHAGLKWMQQFNASAPPPFWGDWVVNAGPRETADRYAAQAQNPETAFLLGPEYAVLRPAFRNLPRRAPNGDVRRVLLSFGGGDDRGLIIQTLSALLENGPSELEYRIMSGARNPGNAHIARWIAANASHRAALSIDPLDVCAEYLACDLAVIAGGTSTFEAAAVGLPMIIVAMADNQINQALGWEERGAAVFVGALDTLRPEDVVRRAAALCADPAAVEAMARAGQENVDGGGCDRLVDRMVGGMS